MCAPEPDEKAPIRNTYRPCPEGCGGWDETWHGLAYNGVPGRSNHARGCPEQMTTVRAGDRSLPSEETTR